MQAGRGRYKPPQPKRRRGDAAKGSRRAGNRRAAMAGRPPSLNDYLFRSFFAVLAGLNDDCVEAAILIVAPVAGLRPVRAARDWTLNLPKPGRETSSPLATASA